MSTKYERISELYADTCKAVVSSPKRWQEFLKSACRNYKLRFDELLLIYAQRPDATAVLEIEQWNKFGRYVKRGSHGIAVFEKAKRTNQRLVHYFDISDTVNSKYARPVPIWKMKEEYETGVINGFEKRFGVIENNITLPDAIVSTVSKIVEASIQNYKRTLIRESENSFLSDLDETAITSVYRNIVSNSVAFLVMTRLDIDTSKYFDDEDFSDITSFNTVETLNAIGLATGEVSQKLLTSAANVVLSSEKERKAIDEKSNNNYNENSSKNIDERSFSDERNQIQDGRRLHASGLWRGREGSGDGAGAGSIRTAEERVPDGVPQAGVHEPLNNGQADGTSFGRGEAGSGADRHADRTDEGKTGLDRGTESQRPDGMGSGNEQHSERSERDSERTGDLRLKPLPSLENQISAIEETEETKTSVFSFSQESEDETSSKAHIIHADIPISERHNFNLNDNEVEYVGKKERFRRNIMAIQLLKKCQDENRFATPEEQVILSKYVGWGGIPEAFDERNSAWATEYLELSTVLTPEEYAAARESTLTAFYTPPEVITAIYSAIENIGFKQGNILEPSCGIGNFIGMLPDSMKDSKIYGVELDKISGNIAQQLYQKHSIAVQGFEETELPDSFFDVAVGNVPFGDFKVIDKRYDKHKFLIHDYFFAKTLDKLRQGGVMAFITSKGTMDKENNSVRKYIAQRAELLGAIRLPNDTFKGNAGTEVVSDILFLQKRDRVLDLSPDWVDLAVNDDGIKMNSYFVQHPEMILGEMKMISGRFGTEATCEPIEGADLKSQLAEAVSKINGTITAYEQNEVEEATEFITADPTVRNFSYTVVDGNLYYRENSRMNLCKVSSNAETRIKEMIKIRDSARNLLDLQKENFPDDDIKAEQENLNKLYDKFIEKYGLLSSRGNSVFKNDSSYPLLTSLEIVNEEGQLERKADMFTKRTIRPHQAVTSVDTASEALALSIGEKATVDMEYMSELTGKSEQEIFAELKGVIFLNPMHGYGSNTQAKYLTADEYLSGNVREKLSWAKKSAQLYPDEFQVNVDALEKVQPKDLTASEISVRLGATWLPSEIVQQFVFELLQTPFYFERKINVIFSQFTGKWNISGKSADRNNISAEQKYGTSRINAYYIIEETLNLKDVHIFDYEETPDGKKKAVLNKRETAIAQSKQELIKQEFQDWIWKDPVRREKLTKMYNEKFNSIRPREYDGSHIIFSGMNPEIKLREHQRNAVAHILYGGNTLLAHVVGAGKSATRS